MNMHNMYEYQQRLKLQDAKFSLIAHNNAIVAIVYKIITSDGKELILKICEQATHYYKEVYFLKYFADILPVAKIIDVVAPESDLHGAVLMECVPGDLLTAKDLTPALAYEIGKVLALIHLNRMDGYGDLTEPESIVKDPRAYFNVKFEESFDECRQHLAADLLDKCHQYHSKYIDLLSTVDGPCIIHRDFRPGNILVQHGKLQGIIDWASGRAGFAEDDFCSLEMGEWTMEGNNKQSFLDGYASIRPIPNYTAIMPLLLLNRAIAVVGFTIKIGTWQHRDAEFYNRNLKILENLDG